MSKRQLESGRICRGGQRADLMAWRRRDELRRSSAAWQHRSAKQYTRKQKHPTSYR
jgi:hypothetical protein